MRKRFRKIMSILLAVVLVFSMFTAFPFSIAAAESGTEKVGASNPYDFYAKDSSGNWANCTWWAWQLAYDNTGVALPGWGNAGTWYNSAVNAGYNCDGTPSANSIAVRNSGGYGHVQFVTDVSGSSIYVKEGGYRGTSNGYHEGWASTSGVIGYIHLGGNPVPDNLRAGVSGSQVYMNWDWDGNADYYNVKLWRNKVWEGDPYRIVWSVKSNNYAFALPKGTYQAYVDACNDNSGYCKMSNVVTFTIGDVGVNLNVGVSGSQVVFTWNQDSNAQYYNLKIWKGYAWEGETYEVVWSIKDTSRYLALPKGTYQAYLDAINDNAGYCSMSSVVSFTVGDSGVDLNISVSGSQVGFLWNQDSNAQYYNLKIWKGYAWEGETYDFVWSIKDTNKYLALPKGTYQAYVDACNDNTGYCKMSNVIQFTVGNTEPILNAKVVGNQVDFSWTKDSKAKLYHLKIWNGHAWMSDTYLVKWNLVETKETVMLPKGEYQAYIDAVEDDNTVMGNVIDIVVETDNYHLPIIGDTNLDGYITISDATAIQFHLAELEKFTDEQLAVADVNGDGEVDINDATRLQMYLADLYYS